MLLLTSTSDVVRVTTGSAADLRAHASWMDNAAGVITPGRTNTASIASATTTTVVGSPGASTQRNVKHLSVRNVHATVSTTVLIEHYDGTTAEALWNGTLLAGESVVLDDRGIWTLYGVDGAAKPSSAKLDAKVSVVNDVVNATTSFADVTGLTVALKSGKRYAFEAHLIHQTNTSTTGAQFGVNIGAAPTSLIVATIDTVTASVTGSAHSAGVVTAVDTAATAQTTGSGAVNVLGILSGFIQPSADGTFAIRCKSEVAVASGLTVKAGSWLRIWELDS